MAPRPLPLALFVAATAVGCAHKSNRAPSVAESYDDGSAAYVEAAPSDASLPELPAMKSSVDVAQASAPVAPGAVMATVPSSHGRAAETKRPTKGSDQPSTGQTADAPDDAMLTMGADVDQMLIFTGQVALMVEHGTTAEAIDRAVVIAVGAGGYVAELNDTMVRVRIPSKNFRRTLRDMEALGDVNSRQVQALDVSEEFHDLKVRLDNLRATRVRIEKLLGQSKDLTQILTVEKELERVSSEIDRIEGRMRLLSSQAAFSTLALAFAEHAAKGDLIVADDGDPPPPPPPRTLGSAADWVGDIGVHHLLRLD